VLNRRRFEACLARSVPAPQRTGRRLQLDGGERPPLPCRYRDRFRTVAARVDERPTESRTRSTRGLDRSDARRPPDDPKVRASELWRAPQQPRSRLDCSPPDLSDPNHSTARSLEAYPLRTHSIGSRLGILRACNRTKIVIPWFEFQLISLHAKTPIRWIVRRLAAME
jgi:hypothetical protein